MTFIMLDGAAKLIFAAAVVALVTVIFWQSAKPRSQAPRLQSPKSPEQYLTLRIGEVPVDKSRDALECDLKSIAEQDLVQLSLVRMDEHIACATATLCTSIPRDELLRRFNQASEGRHPYRYDYKFDGITPVYEDPKGVDVDVIAVPGLGSHPIGAWESNNCDVWLRDFLPNDVSNIRVLLYGYDTKLLKSDSKKSIENIGSMFLESITAFRANNATNRRPVIFIGYSLGGLVIKEALVHAHRKSNNERNIEFLKACYGLLLFGVPNHGLRNEQLKTIVQGQPNEVLVRDLVVDNDSEPSPYLKRISSQFSELCKGKYRVISFFELQRSRPVQLQQDGTLSKTGSKILMVTQESATSTGLVAVADEDNIALDTDHFGLVKYEFKRQGAYPIVKERLKTLVRAGKDEVAKRFAENYLSSAQKDSWNNLNQPRYSSFRNSTKLAKPEKGTLKWLIQEEVVDHDHGLEVRSENTPEQGLCSDDFILWRDSSKSERLLVTALPGQGKSVLSNFILENLEGSISHGSKIIYYFCHIKNDETSRNANSILRALIVQLCQTQQHLFRILPGNYREDSRNFFSAPLDTLLGIFEEMVRDHTYAKVYCVIDGLDVYQEGMKELIVRLTKAFDLSDKAQSNILKLLCTTRPERHILDSWGQAPHKILRCNSADVEIFINSRVTSLGKHFTDEMKDTIAQQLRMKAGRTFLWLDVVIRKIEGISYVTENILKEVMNSPEHLYDLYDILVKEVVRKEKHYAPLLAWVVFSKRPLKLEELEDAMAINPGKPLTRYEKCSGDKPHLTADVVHLDLGTLLDIVDDKVYLIHQSVKDFFEDKDRNPLQHFSGISPRLLPAYASMAYLYLDDFERHPWDRRIPVKEFPLLRYAATYWYAHVESTTDIKSQAPLEEFLRGIVDPDSRKTQLWMTVHKGQTWIKKIPFDLPRHIAIRLDIGWLAEWLLDGKIEGFPDDFDVDWFSEAVGQLAGSVLKVLITHEKSRDFVLSRAVVHNIVSMHSEDVIRLLLEKRGSEVQITPEVIRAAASNWANGEEVMQLLLEKYGSEVQITPDVVMVVAENGTEWLIRFLLEKRESEVQITPEVIRAAARNWRIGKSMMQLLLEKCGSEVQITPEVMAEAARK